MAFSLDKCFRFVLIISCATVLVTTVFLFLLPNNFYEINQQSDLTTVSESTVIPLDLYDSEEWRTVAGSIECDIGKFDDVRQAKLAHFYGRNGLYGKAKSNEFFDNILVFVSGCVKLPVENAPEVIITVRLIQRRPPAGILSAQCFETDKILSTNLLSSNSSNGTGTNAFLIAAKFSRQKCFVDYFLHRKKELLVGYLTFEHNFGRTLTQIELPKIELNKLGNGFVEFVALKNIHLMGGEKQWKYPTNSFHQYGGLPLILAWNKQFFYPYQWDFWPSVLSHNADPNSNCPYQCIYTTEQMAESSASVLLFHVFWSNPIGFWPFWRWPQHRSPEQIYTFFTQESPYYAGSTFNKLPNDWFNQSMTYRSDSTVITNYDELEQITVDTPAEDLWSEEEIRTHVRQKSKLALQIVSKCGTPSGRDLLTAQLSELIPLELFGACNGNDCDQQCYKQSHFFYLAFENSVCPQYVTEKFWNAFRALTVPVVLNRAVLRGMQVPAEAFIFTSADKYNAFYDFLNQLLQLDTKIQQKEKKKATVPNLPNLQNCSQISKAKFNN